MKASKYRSIIPSDSDSTSSDEEKPDASNHEFYITFKPRGIPWRSNIPPNPQLPIPNSNPGISKETKDTTAPATVEVKETTGASKNVAVPPKRRSIFKKLGKPRQSKTPKRLQISNHPSPVISKKAKIIIASAIVKEEKNETPTKVVAPEKQHSIVKLQNPNPVISKKARVTAVESNLSNMTSMKLVAPEKHRSIFKKPDMSLRSKTPPKRQHPIQNPVIMKSTKAKKVVVVPEKRTSIIRSCNQKKKTNKLPEPEPDLQPLVPIEEIHIKTEPETNESEYQLVGPLVGGKMIEIACDKDELSFRKLTNSERVATFTGLRTGFFVKPTVIIDKPGELVFKEEYKGVSRALGYQNPDMELCYFRLEPNTLRPYETATLERMVFCVTRGEIKLKTFCRIEETASGTNDFKVASLCRGATFILFKGDRFSLENWTPCLAELSCVM